jgi:uncharacterized protein (TIGR03086 family)
MDTVTRALRRLDSLIAAVRPDQATLPTPCRSWNARQLVEHVVDEVRRFAESTATGTRGASEPVGDDRPAAFRAAAAELAAAWRSPGAARRTQRLPGGEVPASWVVGQQATEPAVHAWDLAAALGRQADLDPEVGRAALEWRSATIVPALRGTGSTGFHLDPEIAVAAGAPVHERLAALGGRDPLPWAAARADRAGRMR